MNGPTSSPATRPPGREPPPRLAELTADLLWPRLFQAVPLALKVERLGVALFALVLAMLVGSLASIWNLENSTLFVFRTLGAGLFAIAAGLFGLDAPPIHAGIASIAALPSLVWQTYGWKSILLHVPAALILAIAGCAISRMAACDFSQGVVLPWPKALGFALRKTGSLLIALLAPLAIIAAIAAGIALAGALLGWPGVNIVGALLYGLLLIGAAVAILILACWVLGLPLVIPAIACEGADGLDAIQRAYAYVLGRPLRLLIFAAVALLIAWAATLVASVFADATVAFTHWAATGISGTGGAALITQASAEDSQLEGADAVAARILKVWLAIPEILVWSLALSLYFSASTIVYLLIRQVADGQDWGELWMPGMIEGTMAESMRARAAASGTADTAPPARIGIIEDSGRRERIRSDDDDE
jgi:hypothetical protein